MRKRLGFSAWIAAVGLWLAASGAAAEEIRALCAGATKVAVTELARSFHAATGDGVALAFDTVGGIRQRLAKGEAADVAIVSREVLDDMERAEVTVPGVKFDLGTVGIGVAVRAGAPLPDIATPEALRQTLLAAKSIVAVDPAAGGTSGIHFAKVLERLGIAEQIRSRLRLLPGGFVAEAVAKGEAELAVTQITEILPVAGVRLAGPLPAELQKTTTYSGAIIRHTPAAEAATRFLRYLAGDTGRAGFAAAGFGKPD